MRCRSRPRGYLLIETMVSGVIAGSILMTLMIAINQMRLESNKAGRDASAAQLVQQRVEEIRALDFEYLDVMQASSPIVEDIRLGGEYERITEISAKGAPPGCREFEVGGSFINCHDVTVKVSYVLKSELREVVTTLRVYDPNP